MQVGDKIRVRVQGHDDWIFAKNKHPINTYEGTVVRSDPLDPPNTFNLLTGNANYPVSIIAYKNVVDVEVLGRATKNAPSPTQRIVIVRGSKDYRVTLFNSGFAKCDCPGFSFNHKCKHRDLVLRWLPTQYGTNWKVDIFNGKQNRLGS
jgi:hypothetical protein